MSIFNLTSPPDMNDPEYEIKIRDWEEQVHEAAAVARAEEKLKQDLAPNGALAREDWNDFKGGIDVIRRDGFLDPRERSPEDMDLFHHTGAFLGAPKLGAHHVMARILSAPTTYGPGDLVNDIDTKGKEAIVLLADTIHDNTDKRLKAIFGPNNPKPRDTNNEQAEQVASVQGEHMERMAGLEAAPGSTPRVAPPKKPTGKQRTV